MSEAANRFLIAYDIPDDRRRTRIAKLLETYGDRIQFSVFLVDAREAKIVRLQSRLAELMSDDEDSVLLCRLGPVPSCGPDRFRFLGLQRPTTPTDVIIG